MSTKRYTDEFKIEAVRQIVEYGRPVAEVAERLGVSIHSLYGWKRQHGKGDVGRHVEQDQNAEVRRLKAELRRVTEERDILKKVLHDSGHCLAFCCSGRALEIARGRLTRDCRS